MRRYSRTSVINNGSMYGTSYIIPIIRENIKNGNIRTTQVLLQQAERLDVLAGKYYGDATLYWLISIASNIGWMLQTPPNTVIYIPDLADCSKFV